MSHLHIRPHMPDDMNLIYNSWLKSAKEDFDIPNSQFFDSYRDHINEVMANSQILVACDPLDPKFVHGYIVYQQVDDLFILHWAYVKSSFRKMGVMSTLIKSVFPAFKQEPLIITYQNNKRPKMFEKLKAVYKPKLRSLKHESPIAS